MTAHWPRTIYRSSLTSQISQFFKPPLPATAVDAKELCPNELTFSWFICYPHLLLRLSPIPEEKQISGTSLNNVSCLEGLWLIGKLVQTLDAAGRASLFVPTNRFHNKIYVSVTTVVGCNVPMIFSHFNIRAVCSNSHREPGRSCGPLSVYHKWSSLSCRSLPCSPVNYRWSFISSGTKNMRVVNRFTALMLSDRGSERRNQCIQQHETVGGCWLHLVVGGFSC